MCVLRTSCEYSPRHAPTPDTAACGGSRPVYLFLPACLFFVLLLLLLLIPLIISSLCCSCCNFRLLTQFAKFLLLLFLLFLLLLFAACGFSFPLPSPGRRHN